VSFKVDPTAMSLTTFDPTTPASLASAASSAVTSDGIFRATLTLLLDHIHNILHRGGIEAGYWEDVPKYLKELSILKAKDPASHDAIIAGNSNYQSLLRQFPGWKITATQLKELADKETPPHELIRKMGIDPANPKAAPMLTHFTFSAVARRAGIGIEARIAVTAKALQASALSSSDPDPDHDFTSTRRP
jgi:hypothetical protein